MENTANIQWNLFPTKTGLTFMIKCIVRLTDINQSLKNLIRTSSGRNFSSFEKE